MPPVKSDSEIAQELADQFVEQYGDRALYVMSLAIVRHFGDVSAGFIRQGNIAVDEPPLIPTDSAIDA